MGYLKNMIQVELLIAEYLFLRTLVAYQGLMKEQTGRNSK